ncbi:Translation elongation factor P Lys34:lysine transferase [Pseudoalteromonas luteoviolacea B = ATCC 29581]|nr:Translation elongation factor P Lys34:lysine transferase [Pseudoalteromonas luteoviolacea B = ATCC 29581]
MTKWEPSATIATLKQRAQIVAQVRAFFETRGVWEVDTPTLSAAGVSDVHLHTFATTFYGPGFAHGLPMHLQTSPEYPMKRLISAGSGAIYQICKVFRNEEASRRHNPEFTMLEWYRPGFDAFALMKELDELVIELLECKPAEYVSYQRAFSSILGVCPLDAELSVLRTIACERGYREIAEHEQDRDTLLQLLFCMEVEPNIGQERPCFVYDFPASQAALARVNLDDPRVASRFELYYQNLELANGFHELTDAKEQRARFEQDNKTRQTLGLPTVDVDERFLAALSAGMPDCAGVAVGLDRVIMLALNKASIQDVLSFDISRA